MYTGTFLLKEKTVENVTEISWFRACICGSQTTAPYIHSLKIRIHYCPFEIISFSRTFSLTYHLLSFHLDIAHPHAAIPLQCFTIFLLKTKEANVYLNYATGTDYNK